MPRLAVTAARRGVLPAGLSTLATLRREGLSELHWKVLGDGLVRFLSDSGPLLTKLGQILATRGDILPPVVCQRLEALYSGQRPMARAQLRRALARAHPAGDPFERFESEPLAVGSIGQVHRARLKDGKRVVVKIVRPGIDAALRRDLNTAGVLMDLFFASVGRGRQNAKDSARRMLEDLAQGLEKETDLESEADAYEEFGERYAHHPKVRVPICYREWSSGDLLVLEELSGEPLSAIRARARSDPEAARRAADLALREILRQVFCDGRFHADPHGGNLLLLEDGRLGLIDLGLTGELRPGDRKLIARAVKALLARDRDALLRTLLDFGTTPADFEIAAFRADIEGVLGAHQNRVAPRAAGDGGDPSPGLEGLVDDLFGVTGRHGVHLPTSTTLLIKTLVTIEGVARSLDPEINVAGKALPILIQSLAPRWTRWRPWRRAAASALVLVLLGPSSVS